MAKSKTVSAYNKWRAGKYGLFAGALLCPEIPAVIMTAINWDEWFSKSGFSLPFGFASLLVTVIIAVACILNSNTIFKKIDVALFALSALFASIGVTCLLLASLFEQMGYMWLATASGLAGSGSCVVVENKVIEPNVEMYKGLTEEFVLSKKAKKLQARKDRARAEAEAEREGAVE